MTWPHLKTIKIINLIVGLIIGNIHLLLAAAGIFTFNKDTPLLSWVFALAGPLQTLPAVIASFFFPKTGGTWLVAGAIVSFIALALDVDELEGKLQLVLRYCIPMLVLGIAALLIGRGQGERESKNGDEMKK